jgi:hypothetical protein
MSGEMPGDIRLEITGNREHYAFASQIRSDSNRVELLQLFTDIHQISTETMPDD